jgi:hypothetical protein
MGRKKSGKNKKPTVRQMKVIQARANGKTLKEAGLEARYSSKNAAQSAHQALHQIRGRVPELLDRHGLNPQHRRNLNPSPRRIRQASRPARRRKSRDMSSVQSWSACCSARRKGPAVLSRFTWKMLNACCNVRPNGPAVLSALPGKYRDQNHLAVRKRGE